MTPAPLRFVIDVPRYRWRLEDIGGVWHLMPDGRSRGSFTGAPGVLDALMKVTDETEALRFANEHTGLFVKAGRDPAPEIAGAYMSEALALAALQAIAEVRLRSAYIVVAGPRDAETGQLRKSLRQTLAEVGPILAGALSDLRDARGHVPDDSEGAILGWIDATAREHWEIDLPLLDWVMLPMSAKEPVRASEVPALIDPWPRVRCISVLGYAYAQLVAEVGRRSGLIQSWQDVEWTRTCVLCGGSIPEIWADRKVRSDRLYCFRDSCLQRANTMAQRRRRSRT